MKSPRLWLRVHEMSEEFFRNEIPRTSTSNTFYSILIYAVISLAFSIFQTLFSKSSNPFSELSPEAGIYSLITGMGLVCLVVIIPIGFYISNGIYYGIASLLGGKGTFSSQAYITSLFIVPIGVLSFILALFSAIPVIGWFIYSGLALIVSIFNIILTVRCYKAVHNFSTGRAVAVVLFTPGACDYSYLSDSYSGIDGTWNWQHLFNDYLVDRHTYAISPLIV